MSFTLRHDFSAAPRVLYDGVEAYQFALDAQNPDLPQVRLDVTRPEAARWRHYYVDAELNALSRLLGWEMRFVLNKEWAYHPGLARPVYLYPLRHHGEELTLSYAYDERSPWAFRLLAARRPGPCPNGGGVRPARGAHKNALALTGRLLGNYRQREPGMITFIIMIIATFVQTVSGFGIALVAMPFLVGAFGIQTAAPLMSLCGASAGLALLIRYRAGLNPRAVSRLVAASLLGIPLGIVLLRRVDPVFFSRLLGVMLIAYAIYALRRPAVPSMANRRWAYLFGFVAGLTAGAYAIGGPPVIVYAASQQWDATAFKSNLQSFFFVTGLVLIAGHALSGNFTGLVLQQFALAVPGILIGLGAGAVLDRFVDALRFRRLVLYLLLLMGAQLIFQLG